MNLSASVSDYHQHIAAAMKTVTYPIVYPDSDGQPMADNTEQYEWITRIKGNLDIIFAKDENLFVAGDLLWYPVEGNPGIRVAPDVLVAFGRPKGYRGSYMQWKEDNVAPQVVFEILSPGNTAREMRGKRFFYDKHGVEEYYVYDPSDFSFEVWRRWDGELHLLGTVESTNCTSPRLGVYFLADPETELRIFRPDGQPFRTMVEIEEERQRAQEQAYCQSQRAEAEFGRAERLAAKLRELGIDPENV